MCSTETIVYLEYGSVSQYVVARLALAEFKVICYYADGHGEAQNSGEQSAHLGFLVCRGFVCQLNSHCSPNDRRQHLYPNVINSLDLFP